MRIDEQGFPSGDEIVRVIAEYVKVQRLSDVSNLEFTLSEFRRLIPKYSSASIRVVDSASSGLGVLATTPIPRGTCILVDHPIARVLDCELGECAYSSFDGSDSLALADVVASNFDMKMEKSLLRLHPFRSSSGSGCSVELAMPEEFRRTISSKLPSNINADMLLRTVQCNSLGFYTLPELCSYNNHLRFLTGTGLYPEASFFNHSCTPNVSHCSFGDVTVFRVNRDINQGEELFISYIGSDLLCETTSVRHEFLGSRDFVCCCRKCSTPDKEDPWVEELSLHMRVSINLIKEPERRRNFIKKLLEDHSFVQKDRLDLLFQLGRDFNEDSSEAWQTLLKHARTTDDFGATVIIMHFMVRNGFSNELYRLAVDKAQLALGPAIGQPATLFRLFGCTDFSKDSSFGEEFRELFSRLSV